MKKIIIAIDGPAGSGKTSSAKIVAEKLSYIYVDTGAMYRAVTLSVLRNNVLIEEPEVLNLMQTIKIELEASSKGQLTLLNGEDVSLDIRLPEVTKLVSPVSAMGCVRDLMVAQQRELGKRGGVVMDGRDIGTVVFPQAELKIFLVASIDTRVLRRSKELAAKGIDFDFVELKQQILDRDQYDSSRSHSPLKKALDSIEIDTSLLSLQEQTAVILDLAEKAITSQSF